MPQRPQVTGFFDERTFSIQYVVADPATTQMRHHRPGLDFDEKSGATATRNADAILRHIENEKLDAGLDSRHASACRSFLGRVLPEGEDRRADRDRRPHRRGPGALAASSTIGRNWPRTARNGTGCLPPATASSIGDLEVGVMFSPGHTLASVTYVVGDAAFIHDTLFMPDSGTARADFPGGSSTRLWRSIQAILALPDDTRLFTGHDYQPGGRRAAHGKARSPSRSAATFISRNARPRRNSSPCATRATRHCRCPS